MNLEISSLKEENLSEYLLDKEGYYIIEFIVPERECYITKCPDQALFIIFNYLDIDDIMNFCSTNRKFKSYLSNDSFEKLIDEKIIINTFSHLTGFESTYNDLSLQEIKQEDSLPINLMDRKQIGDLDIHSIDDQEIDKFFESNPSVQYIIRNIGSDKINVPYFECGSADNPLYMTKEKDLYSVVINYNDRYNVKVILHNMLFVRSPRKSGALSPLRYRREEKEYSFNNNLIAFGVNTTLNEENIGKLMADSYKKALEKYIDLFLKKEID
jgi:hypothetical protein